MSWQAFIIASRASSSEELMVRSTAVPTEKAYMKLSVCRTGAKRWKSAIPMPRGLKQRPVTTTARQTETLTGLSRHFKLETQIWQTSCYLPIFASREAMACWSAPANTSLSWLVIGTHSVCTRIRRSPANSTVLLSINLSWTKNKHPPYQKKRRRKHTGG